MASNNPIIQHGASITELSELFGMDRKDIRLRIANIMPQSSVGASTYWRVSDVAPSLVKLDDSMTDLVSRVLSLHHTDLPKMLSKEYWYGQNQRIKFLKETGELWDTSAVVKLAAEVFKTLRLSLMLSSDAVERETGLTPRQREIIESTMHAALEDAREKLVVQLNELRDDAGNSGKTFAPQENLARVGFDTSRYSWSDGGTGEPKPGDEDYI